MISLKVKNLLSGVYRQLYSEVVKERSNAEYAVEQINWNRSLPVRCDP